MITGFSEKTDDPVNRESRGGENYDESDHGLHVTPQ